MPDLTSSKIFKTVNSQINTGLIRNLEDTNKQFSMMKFFPNNSDISRSFGKFFDIFPTDVKLTTHYLLLQ